MRHLKAAMVLAGAGLVSWNLSGAFAAEDVAEEKVELAQEIVELQRTRDFFQAQWDSEKRAILDSVPAENRGAKMKTWLKVMREQMVDGQAEEMTRALAEVLDEASLRSAARLLDQPGYQEWLTDQLEVFPVFLDRMRDRQHATASVMADEVGGFDQRKRRMSEIPPIGDSRLGDALGLAPGAHLDVELGKQYAMTYRFPVADRGLAKLLPDLSAELFPGMPGAHVISISGSRAFATQSDCEAARGKMAEALTVYFPETKVSDCGTKSHLNVDGTTRMRTRCQAQDLGSSVLLELNITHLPTMKAAYGVMEPDAAPEKAGG